MNSRRVGQAIVLCRLSIFLAFAGPVHSLGTLFEFTTYIGDANTTHVARIRADAAGNTYIAGNRSSGSLSQMFVAKVDAGGKLMAFLTFGGNGTDTVKDMALDSSGSVYLAGSTSSTSFPLVHPLQATPGPGFVAKVDANNQIVFATFFPAAVSAIAVDEAGNVYVTGSTISASFPVTDGMPNGRAGGSVPQIAAAFITKIAATGDKIVYSGRFSGMSKPCGCCSSCFLSSRYAAGVSIAVGPAGNAYIAGNTDTTDIPTTAGAFQQNGIGAFVAKVDAAGAGLSYLTYIGSANYILSPNNTPGNLAAAIAVDASGSAYLAGATFDPAFPATPGTYQTKFSGPVTNDPYPPPPPDAYVLKLKPDGSGLVWATFIGGPGADAANAIALDAFGNEWVAGTTASANFPNPQGWSEGSDFVTGMNPAGSSLVYSARFPAASVAQSVAIDPGGLLHVAGSGGSISTIAPSNNPTPRIFGVSNAAYGPASGQAARGELISIYGPHIGPATPTIYSPTSDGFVPTTLGGVQVLMGSHPIPLLYVSDSQINAVAPYSLFSNGGGLGLQIATGATNTPVFPIAFIDADPQIFQRPDGTAAAVNQDGTINSSDHPAPVGSVLSIWITGVGSTSAYLQEGQIATGPKAFACCTVFAGFTPDFAQIMYSGSAPGVVNGVVQINFVVPPEAQWYGQTMQVSVGVGAKTSNLVTIYVKQ